MNVSLVLCRKDGAMKGFPLESSVTVIGRQQECDLCIPLMIVSRRHCQLNRDGGELRVRDLGSRNGTYVNGQKVEEASLNPGDELHVGPLKFAVQVDGQPALTDSTILRPPEHLSEPAKQVVDDVEDFTGLDDVHALNDHHTLEILDDLVEEVDGNQSL